MAAPSWTKTNAAGNILANQSVAATVSVTTGVLDFTSKVEVVLSILNSFSNNAPAATTNTLVQVFAVVGTGNLTDNQPVEQIVIPSTQNTANRASIRLPSGRYNITVKNQDTTNATTVEITSETYDSFV